MCRRRVCSQNLGRSHLERAGISTYELRLGSVAHGLASFPWGGRREHREWPQADDAWLFVIRSKSVWSVPEPVSPAFTYRVTRYDPALRDGRGAFVPSTWTARSDIGRSFDGHVLTEDEYLRAEDAYVSSAMAFMHEAGVDRLTMVGVEDPAGHEEPGLTPSEGGTVAVGGDFEASCRAILRERFWCRLESATAGAYVHFGRDFYMYVGVPRLCPEAVALASSRGLSAEPLRSPYERA